MLPIGTTRVDIRDYEEVTVPPARPVPPRSTERLIPVAELEPLASGSFPVLLASYQHGLCLPVG